jgi:hypothetical protein
MMTDRKLMQQALHALEWNLPVLEDYGDKEQLQRQHKAITALRDRLTQPEQELMINCPRCGHCCPQSNQEPVAWRTFDGEGGYDYRNYEDNEEYAKEWEQRNPKYKGWVEPLYATPLPSTWFGLTDEEIETFVAHLYPLPEKPVRERLQALLTKLRERNT